MAEWFRALDLKSGDTWFKSSLNFSRLLLSLSLGRETSEGAGR